MTHLAKLPYASVIVSIIALAIVNNGTPNMSAWPYTQNNVNAYPMPMKAGDTVPFYGVVLFGVLMWLLFSVFELFALNRSQAWVPRIRFAMLIGMTMLEVFFVTATLTGMGKYYVAEPRPDFKTRCLGSPDATPTYDANGEVICTGSTSVIREGRDSFPSGHASTSFCFGVFGTLYLLWLAYVRNVSLPWRSDMGCMTLVWYQVSQAFFCVCLVPLFVAFGVAATRVHDHRHSPADVTAGAFLGTLVSCAYFFVRIVHEAPELDCPDSKSCDCGQVYRRVSNSEMPLSPSANMNPSLNI